MAAALLDRLGRSHLRASHHPLFSLLLYPIVQVLLRIPGMSGAAVFGLLVSTAGAVWIGLTWATLRAIGLRRPEATIFALLAASSAAAVFWFPTLESQTFGASSIMLAVGVVALAERGWRPSLPACVAVSLATLSFTTTNWMFGLLMLGAVLPWQRAVLAAVLTLGIAAILVWVQALIFPAAGSPLALNTPAETAYLFNPEALGFLEQSRVFFLHAIVMPGPDIAHGFRLSIQGATHAGPLALVAIGIWIVLLALGNWSIGRSRVSRSAAVILFGIAGQWTLALVFGVETFFYSLRWAPLLVLLAGFSALAPPRRLGAGLAAVLVLLAAVNNVEQFRTAAAVVAERYETERQFASALFAVIDPREPVLCGRQPLAATGESVLLPPLESIVQLPPDDVVLPDDPDTCFYLFDRADERRIGWMLPFEHWSEAAIDAFREAGARYFVTPYAWGIEQRPDLFRTLDRRFRRLGDRDTWRVYDLTAPGSTTAGPGPR